MAVFRIIHVSDLHFAEIPDQYNALQNWDSEPADLLNPKKWFAPGSFNPLKALALARIVTEAEEDAHLLLVTGDVGTTGSINDLAVALSWMTGDAGKAYVPAIERNPTCAVPKLGDFQRIALVPGNHDRYVDSSKKPRSAHFETKFGNAWDLGRQNGEIVGDGVRRVFVRDSGECLAVLSADFSINKKSDATRPIGYIGQGRVHASVLKTLCDETRRLRSTAAGAPCVIWAAHFPPGFPSGASLEKLHDEDKLLDAAKELSVPLIFAGHTHKARIYKADELNVICAGTGCGCGVRSGDEHSFFAVELSVSGGTLIDATVHQHSWDDEDANFKKEPVVQVPV